MPKLPLLPVEDLHLEAPPMAKGPHPGKKTGRPDLRVVEPRKQESAAELALQGIRPLVELRPNVPAALDGSIGTNRADPKHLQIVARNDYEALDAFLAEYDQSPGTQRLFSRECERLALWAFHEAKKPISSLTRQDFEDYVNFLVSPPADWRGKKARREKPEWRPFVSGLKEGALLNSLNALNSMMNWWLMANYIGGNPLGLMRQRRRKMGKLDVSEDTVAEEAATTKKPKASKASTKVKHGISEDSDAKIERFLDADMWAAVEAAVEELNSDDPVKAADYERARFICSFLYMLAPRAGEMESHSMNCFRQKDGKWWWHVIGKGNKAARTPMPADMVEALARYRRSLGLSAMPTRTDDSPLLRSTRYPGRGITSRWLNMILKDIFKRACFHLPAKVSWKAETLEKASAHWGRHTGITAKINAGMKREYVQKDARHSDSRTTDRYIHVEEDAWHAEAQKQKLGWGQHGATPSAKKAKD